MRSNLKFNVNGRHTTVIEDGHIYDGIDNKNQRILVTLVMS